MMTPFEELQGDKDAALVQRSTVPKRCNRKAECRLS
jgi:hypothetical protein